MRYPVRSAIKKFNELLGLEEDPLGQDWEVECSDPNRLEEFIRCYNDHAESDSEKITLMALMLGAFEHYHALNHPDENTWEKVKAVLVKDIHVHQELVEYYQCNDEIDGEDIFPITRKIREINL